MLHIIMGSLWQHVSLSTEITIDIGYDPLGFLPGV